MRPEAEGARGGADAEAVGQDGVQTLHLVAQVGEVPRPRVRLEPLEVRGAERGEWQQLATAAAALVLLDPLDHF